MKLTNALLAAIVGMLLLAATASASITRTELAGNSLPEFPFFEYVKAFNANAPVKIAIDPTRFPSIVGKTCDIYVVNAKSGSQWITNPSLTDVRPGGAQTQTFSGTTIQANTFQIAGPSVLNGNGGTDLGVGYDVVLDCDRNGVLSDGDFIDGGSGEAGFYVVNDTSAAGPLAVTEVVYNLDSTVAASFGIPPGFFGEDLYYPATIATMGRRPLVVIGHGNGHNFQWYGHIGRHLASYGYVVVSIANNTGPGPDSAADTTLGHTDAFLDQAEAGAIAGGALVGHIDSHKIVWIGHSRGAEAVAISYNRLFNGTHTPVHFAKNDIRLISSTLPTDWTGTDDANPRDANYHLWTASGDADVNGSAGCQLCQTFHLADRATGYKQSTIVQGTGHGEFHDYPPAGDVFTGPCGIGRSTTHLIQLGYLLPLVKHYVDGNIPALDFLTRPYESFRPIGIPSDPCIFVSDEYRNGAAVGNFVIDDYQTPSTGTSSSGGTVTFNVDNLTKGLLHDNNSDFTWMASDPFNGATQSGVTDWSATRHDDSRGVVFDWTDSDRFYEWQVPASNRNFSNFLFLSFRAAQGTQHPNTLASPGYLNFTVTLRDGLGTTSSIRIAAHGGGLVQPYARDGGWHNEMRTISIRTTDFLDNGSGLNLSDVVAVRLNFGPSFGSSKGRIVLADLMLTNDVTPFALPSMLKYQGDTSADYHDPANLSALLTDKASGQPIANASVQFTLGSQVCTATTNASGVASCTVVLDQCAGSYTVNATFAGSALYLPSSDSKPFTINLEETTLSYTGDTVIANGGTATLSGVLLEDNTTPVAGRTVTFTLGSGGSAQTCSAVTNASGLASCAIGPVAQPLGPGTATDSFAGDACFRPASASAKTILFAFLASGAFVVGDQSAQMGAKVTFWGAKWSKVNKLSGGTAPASFKGFAVTLSAEPPKCGITWTTGPGSSSNPPATVPTYMGVLVSSKVTKSGSKISGDAKSIVVVKTDPGYAPNPGHAGTGTVVAEFCHQ